MLLVSPSPPTFVTVRRQWGCCALSGPLHVEFNLSDGEEEGVVVVEEVVIPEDNVVYVGRTTNLLDLRATRNLHVHVHVWGIFICTHFALNTCNYRLGMSIRWQSNSIPIKAWLVYGALQIENN